MRIIAGQYRGRRFSPGPGSRIRPTSDFLRETLFNILAGPETDDASLLDLCCGTGAVGVEALSRGFSSATFVDSCPRAMAGLRRLLEELDPGLSGRRARLLRLPADRALALLAGEGARFDVVFADPPYPAAEEFFNRSFFENCRAVIRTGGRLVCQHPGSLWPEGTAVHARPFVRTRLRKAGESACSFFSLDLPQEG